MSFVSKKRERVGFKKENEVIGLPNMIEIQVKSYRDFLQMDKLPQERKAIGLEAILLDIFPIKLFGDSMVLEYLMYNLGVPKYSPEECIRRGITYSVVLKITCQLTDETGIKKEEVYIGSLPIMTEVGTFIINGSERVVVSQIHKSQGIFFEKEQHPKNVVLYSFKIIPYMGSWLEASFDINNLIYIYVDKKKRRKKVLATSFLRVLGYSVDTDIIEEFFDTQRMKINSERDFVRMVGKILAEDVIGEADGASYGKVGEKLTTAMLKGILDAKIPSVKIAEGADETSPIIKMLYKDPTDSYESALKDLYRKIRPGEPATLANARALIVRLFFDPKTYNLGAVGRYKMNIKLGLTFDETSGKNTTLNKKDIIMALKYLLRLKKGDKGFVVDDIDHLSNRRVRSVGELVQNQCRIGFMRMEKIIRERMNTFDFYSDTLMPSKIISTKGFQSIIKDFFGRSNLSQFMDQTNPLAELTHKRRLSSLGPGGLSRDRAGFEVRDVHRTHYGKICIIETPEGPNIGLITSLSAYAKINEFGFIETPYRVVRENVVTSEIEYMTADREERCIIAQAGTPLDEYNMFAESVCWARHMGDPLKIDSSKVTHMDVSTKQVLSVVTGLIPFLEHNDANRALMGSNMQRQAVPLLIAEAPIVGTGMESIVGKDSGAVVLANEDGVVEYVDGFQIVVAPKDSSKNKTTYKLKKFLKSNAGSCINQTPIVNIGTVVKAGDVIADGPSTDCGEIALGKNVLVAFMPWCGYNYEDAIIISEKLIKADTYTSIHLEEFELSASDTKLGNEEITRDIPNVSEEALRNLGDNGIVKIGSEVKPGDILVGKVSPKLETELSPEERLLRAIFGEQSADVKDSSLRVKTGTEGVVVDVRVFNRRDRISKTEDDLVEEREEVSSVQKEFIEEETNISINLHEKLSVLLMDKPAPGNIMDAKSGDLVVKEGSLITQDLISTLESRDLNEFILDKHNIYDVMKNIVKEHIEKLKNVRMKYLSKIEGIKKGDIELDSSVICQVKVYIATKRKLEVGDKMAGRHGNKGVVSKLVPECDMPYMSNGDTVEIILNTLGILSRMNLGQIFETHLGFAAKHAGIYVKSPVFQGFPEAEIWKMMGKTGLSTDGKMVLYDGRTGERFDNRVVVGYIYMLKLCHLVSDKMHARSIGPYSLVTQQPLGGKAQMGGQRCGEMEVWTFNGYGAANSLQEMLTVKSDDVSGRTNMYSSIVKGENILDAGIPESFNVLVKEIQGLCLDISPNS